jgi:hypothetical protein
MKTNKIKEDKKPMTIVSAEVVGADFFKNNLFKKLEEEIELIRKLKASFPDMLDFNNCLKELRRFWKQQATADLIKRVLEIHRRLSDEESSWNDYCKYFERELKQMLVEKN